MNITDIAPVIMEVLGIDFTAPDGVLHPEILECFEGEIPFGMRCEKDGKRDFCFLTSFLRW